MFLGRVQRWKAMATATRQGEFDYKVLNRYGLTKLKIVNIINCLQYATCWINEIFHWFDGFGDWNEWFIRKVWIWIQKALQASRVHMLSNKIAQGRLKNLRPRSCTVHDADVRFLSASACCLLFPKATNMNICVRSVQSQWEPRSIGRQSLCR